MSNTNSSDFNAELQKLYLQKDYSQLLGKLKDSEPIMDSGLYHYNLGSVYLKQDELAQARFHLEKAIQEGVDFGGAQHNLSIVRERLQVLDVENRVSSWEKALFQVKDVPFDILVMVALLLINLLVFVTRPWAKWVSGVGLALVFCVGIVSQIDFGGREYAIVMKTSELREGPSKAFKQQGELPIGLKVRVKDYKDGWLFVDFPRDFTGWVSKSDTRKL